MPSRTKGTYGTIDNWVLFAAPRLPLAAGWVLLALENQSNYDRSRGLTLAGLCEATGREPDQVRRGVALLLEYGMAQQDGRTYLIGSGERANEALNRQEERKSAGIKARTNARLKERLKETSDPQEIATETAKNPPLKDKKDLKDKKELQRESVSVEMAPQPNTLSEKGEGREGEEGSACGAGAPGGAYQAPDRPFIVRFQPTANARNDGATSPEDVPPGAAAGGGGLALSPPGATRTALEIAFGPAFLAQLLGEGGARQGWLSLDAGRVAELHQAALDSSGPRPWRTRFISQLDLEVTGRGKRSRDLTAEEWIA